MRSPASTGWPGYARTETHVLRQRRGAEGAFQRVPLFFRVAISKRRVPKRRPPQTGCSPRCTLSHHVCTRVRFSRRQDASRCTPLGNRPVITGDARPEGPGQKDTISFHRRPATHPAQAHRHEQDPRRVGSSTIRTNKEHVKRNLCPPHQRRSRSFPARFVRRCNDCARLARRAIGGAVEAR
jgi:hypothetical protein